MLSQLNVGGHWTATSRLQDMGEWPWDSTQSSGLGYGETLTMQPISGASCARATMWAPLVARVCVRPCVRARTRT